MRALANAAGTWNQAIQGHKMWALPLKWWAIFTE